MDSSQEESEKMTSIMTVQDVQEVMNSVRDTRRKLINAELSVEDGLSELERYHQLLLDAMPPTAVKPSEAKEPTSPSTNNNNNKLLICRLGPLEDSGKLTLNLADETRELEFDIAFFKENFNNFSNNDSTSSNTTPSSPKPVFKTDSIRGRIGGGPGRNAVSDEIDRATTFLRESFPDLILVTDWDGTFKSYGNNYRTCMQPYYSAAILREFVGLTKFSAVLTAGPLRNPGILDLTALTPSSSSSHAGEGDGVPTFGGCWGREWLIGGETYVEDSAISIEHRELLYQLTADIDGIITKRFPAFRYIGSGFQRKVDRVTIGIQNVSADISETVSNALVDAVTEIARKYDSAGTVFRAERHKYDLEVMLRMDSGSSSSGAQKTGDESVGDGHGSTGETFVAPASSSADQLQSWTKARGLEYLVSLKDDVMQLATSTPLICGDTLSDVPMVQAAVRMNPERARSIFVNPTAELRSNIEGIFNGESRKRLLIVSCPQIIHIAMANIVNEQQ